MLELPDDFDLAQSYWLSLQKGPEVEEPKLEPTEGVEDANIDAGSASEVASGESSEGGETNQSGGPQADASGGDANTGEPEPRRTDEGGDSNTSQGGDGEQRATTTVTTVRPSGPDAEPSKPEPDDEPRPRRRGPKFKRHRHWREHSVA